MSETEKPIPQAEAGDALPWLRLMCAGSDALLRTVQAGVDGSLACQQGVDGSLACQQAVLRFGDRQMQRNLEFGGKLRASAGFADRLDLQTRFGRESFEESLDTVRELAEIGRRLLVSGPPASAEAAGVTTGGAKAA
jgi:hypothetical protein